jgi:cytoskeleton protein RodZ
MTDFGQRIRRERESRGVSLREMSEATKIAKRYLEALERNDFDALPGGVFVRGYIRNYAEHLGLDPEPLLEEYQRERRSRGADGDEEEQAARDAAQAVLSNLAASRGVSTGGWRRTGWAVGVGLLAVVAIAVLGWIFLFPSAKEYPDQAAIPPPAAESEPLPTVETEPPPPVEPEPTAATGPERVAPRTEPVGVESRDEEGQDSFAQRASQPEVRAPESPPSSPAPAAGSGQPEQETGAGVIASEPAQLSAPQQEDGAGPSRLSVPDHGVGTGVADRQLVGRGERFPEGAPVWFWTRVLGGRPGDTIRHVWIREGRVQGEIELNVGGPHWRTQSRWSMRAGSAGAWAVEVRDAEGSLLARDEFTCLPVE